MTRKEFGFKHSPLTKKQILAMDAGWQLDEAVAMLVMGWQAFSYQSGMTCSAPSDLIPYLHDDHVSNIRPTPKFSTDDAEAMKVIRRVGANCSWHIGLSTEHCSVLVAGLSVLLCHGDPDIYLESVNAGDFAKLVCQAALLSDCVQGSCVPILKRRDLGL